MQVQTKYTLVYRSRPLDAQGVPTLTGEYKYFDSVEEAYAFLAQLEGPEGMYKLDTHIICSNPE